MNKQASTTLINTRQELINMVEKLNRKIKKSHEEDTLGVYDIDRELIRKTRDDIITIINNINALQLKEAI